MVRRRRITDRSRRHAPTRGSSAPPAVGAKTFEPSAAGSSAAPGQRLNCFVRTVAELLDRRSASGTQPGPSVALEGVEHLDRAREVADGVVAARGREVVGPAVEVERVRAAEGDDRRAVPAAPVRSPGRRRERLPTPCVPPPKSMVRRFVSRAADSSGGKVCWRSFRSLFGPGEKTICAQVAHGRAGVPRERPQLSQERAQLARHGPRGVHERVDVVERGAEVDERRVRLAHEGGQPLEIDSASAPLARCRARGTSR